MDALEILNRPSVDGALKATSFLACGFTPLHLKTLLQAELRRRVPQKQIEMRTGLFGDLIGSIERLKPDGLETCFAVVEWADLDPRFGIRSLGGWKPALLPDIMNCAERFAARLLAATRRVSAAMPVIASLPTLPLPPLFYTRSEATGPIESRLHESIAHLAAALTDLPNVRVLNAQALSQGSPPDHRMDVKSDIVTGFPYTLEHASVMAELLAQLADSRPAKKGLITDLDDTLWSGILGEDGVNGISWHLEHGTHMHGLYQQFLASLAGAGVLIAIASKNDSALVESAFDRSDLLISRRDIFPLEIHWSPKSESVKRILKTWSVGADSVVFVDDSAMEAAEVKAAFPEMECIVFPKGDYRGIWQLLKRLRTLFGKSVLTETDSIRLESIRKSSGLRESMTSTGWSADDFLRASEGSIIFSLTQDGADTRAFELVNKTNQFNLNGRRLSDSEWLQFFKDPEALLLTAQYEDKYGALGEIAVLLGTKCDSRLRVHSWVMSCRAFSRRIEHECLSYLFEELGIAEIAFDYRTTARNGPLQDFFEALLEGPPTEDLRLTQEIFARNAPPLFHRVRKAVHV